MDRAEERSCRAKALGISTVRGPGGSKGNHSPLRSFEAVRQLLPAFLQAAAKHRDGAKVTKRYHPPQTPSDRLLRAESVPEAAKDKLRQIAAELDPLKLLEEMRAMQAYLAALADGDATPATTTEPPNLSTFMASLSSAWHAGEVRPTFSVEAKPRYLRSLQKIAVAAPATKPTEAEIITLERTQWIVEADIKGFFDNVHTNT